MWEILIFKAQKWTFEKFWAHFHDYILEPKFTKYEDLLYCFIIIEPLKTLETLPKSEDNK